MLRRFEVMGSHNEAFGVGDERMDPREEEVHFPESHLRVGVMLKAEIFKSPEGSPSVGADPLARREGSLGHIQDVEEIRVLGDFHSDEGGIAGPIGADGYPNRFRAAGFSSRFPLDPFSPEEGIIQLDEAGQLIAAVPVGHGGSDLVAHRPDGLIGADAQEALSFQHGDAVLVVAHEKDEPEPLAQRGPGFVEDGPGGQRDLIPAAFALVKTPAAVVSRPVASAARAVKPFGPAMALKVFAAGEFGGESALNTEHVVSLIHRSPPGIVDVILPYAGLIG